MTDYLKPVAWVIPGDDTARGDGSIDAMAWAEGEFTRPLYAGPPDEDRMDTLTEALWHIDAWSRAYPVSIFPEPDLEKARELLEAGGMTLDSISASCMRHVITEVGEIARAALRSAS